MKILIALFPILLFSCIQHEKIEPDIEAQESQNKIKVKYAQGFELIYKPDMTILISKSFGENEKFRDSLVFLHSTDSKVNNTSAKFHSNIELLACQSSTHLSFLDILNKMDKVKGLCGMQYVQDLRVLDILDKNMTIELCLGESVQLETLFEVNPDLFLIYPFGNTESKKFARNGIPVLLIAEYLEKTQLARLEWIKVFGLLMNEVDKANAYFEEVESEYLALKKEKTDENMKFILNLPFQDSWFMPSAQSLTVGLIEDAGLSYYYKDEIGTENILHPKEKVWDDAMSANYWVIIASRPEDFTLEDLIKEEGVYSKFKSVKYKQVIFCNTGTSDYFSKGLVEPHLMLKDILFATHQIDNYTPKYFHLLQ